MLTLVMAKFSRLFLHLTDIYERSNNKCTILGEVLKYFGALFGYNN